MERVNITLPYTANLQGVEIPGEQNARQAEDCLPRAVSPEKGE